MQSPSSLTVTLELGALAQSTVRVKEAPCSSPQEVLVLTTKASSKLVQGLSTLAVRFLLSPLALWGESAG